MTHPEVRALPGQPITDEQRRPLLDADGHRLLTELHEHAAAPSFNHRVGDRLTAAGLAAVQALDAATSVGSAGTPWLPAFVRHALATVPRYRGHGPWSGRLETLPTVARQDLVDDPYSFVPDDLPLDDLVVFTTTGTSDGRKAFIPSTPVAAAAYQVMLRAALRTRGVELVGGPGRTAIALVCWQRSTYTYASVSSFLGQAGVVKLNLNPSEWRRPSDVAAFLDALAPEVVTGDPVAFTHLAELPLALHPKALVSSAMTMLPGLAASLEERFGCPVLDVYGMNEAGPIAVGVPGGHRIVQPRLHVEILSADGRVLPVGERGEITLTGGFNPAFPLLRYRTGDRAALDERGLLVGFEGRAPVRLVAAGGAAVNTIDVSVALRALPIARYTLHQGADLSLELGLDDLALASDCVAALAALFGAVPISVVAIGDAETVAYTSEL